MHRNFLYGNNQKISKAIQLSLSYKNHRKSLENIKPAIQIPSLSNIKKKDSITANRLKYFKQSRDFKNKSIKKQNQTNVKRLLQASSVFWKNKIFEQSSNPLKINEPHLPQSKSKSRISSRNTLNSSDSQRSILSNLMTRTRRNRQIATENKKIAQRIQNPKMDHTMRFKLYDKQYQKQKEYLKIRSRFSQRSKSIMQSLMLDGLKIDKKHLQFLPQITDRGNKLEENKISFTSRIVSANGEGTQDGEEILKTLQFGKNLGNIVKKAVNKKS